MIYVREENSLYLKKLHRKETSVTYFQQYYFVNRLSDMLIRQYRMNADRV